MASRNSSFDQVTRPLMSEPTLDEGTRPGRLHPDMVARPLSPPAQVYRDEDGKEKAWPLNKVLMWCARPSAVALAFAEIIVQLSRTHGNNNGVSVALPVFILIAMFWNLFKMIPRVVLDKLLASTSTDGKGDDTEVSCTVGRWKVFCHGGDVEEGDGYGETPQHQQVRKPSLIQRVVRQGFVDLILASFVMLFAILFSAEQRWYPYRSDKVIVVLASILAGLQYIMVLLPHVSSCGPISITLNYNPKRDEPYQYRIRLPEDGPAAQPVSVAA